MMSSIAKLTRTSTPVLLQCAIGGVEKSTLGGYAGWRDPRDAYPERRPLRSSAHAKRPAVWRFQGSSKGPKELP